MSDSKTTIHELREIVRSFVKQREWEKFHTPKNLSMALAVEVAELMEHFQWLATEEAASAAQQPEKLAAISDEIADVLCYTLALANSLEIDLSDAVCGKMEKNERKYPAKDFHGRGSSKAAAK